MIASEIPRIRTPLARWTDWPIVVNGGGAGKRSPDLPGQHADNSRDMQLAVCRATVSPVQRRRHVGAD